MRLLPALFSLTLSVVAGGASAASAQAQVAPQEVPRTSDGAPIIIFFAWDRPVIDGDAAARLDALVAAVANAGVRLELAGHADRSGPEAPNVRAGRKRAEAVRAYLAARGVPGAALRVVSYGEKRPLIATADGVREPQNRRVEIRVVRTPGS